MIFTWISLFILVILIGAFSVLLLNLIRLKRLDQFPAPSHWPRVSVLIPARNEENNIQACVQSFLDQDYPDFDVLVLNDESTDNTLNILTQLSSKYQNLKVFNGKHLPEGWMGKHWACQQLSEAATGELILFTDADTIHHPLTLQEAVSSLEDQNADLLTAIPYEILGSWGEKIMLPYIFISPLLYIPIGIAHRVKNPTLCFSIGQFMLFKQDSYKRIGGHEALKGIPMEDLLMGRRIKAFGLRWRMVDGGLRVRCRMYHDFKTSWKGLTRFLFLGYENNIAQLILAWGLSILIFLGPLLALIMQAFGMVWLNPISFSRMLISLSLTLAIWLIACWRLRYPIYLALFFPVIIFMNFVATLHSMYLTKTGRSTWKDRPLFRNGV